ncbi:Superkiller protein 3 [Orbilia blumenaviensis]|uniref:Superkiller protein 3 n=1 Tax=Orbilia blumenaviensis TaxID=1796055 RepID=A0AAV9VM72_9PEZI
MSKAASKALVKAAKTAIDHQKWDEARDAAFKIVQADPKQYVGHIFLGLSQFRLHEVKDGEKSYRDAIQLSPSEAMAWQGLMQLYEETQQIDEYLDAATELAVIHMQKEDRAKFDALINKVLPFVEARGSRAQHKKALKLQLPESPIYEFLEASPAHSIPPPDITYQKLADIIEAEEKELINTQIAARKSRLGATERSVTIQVKQEVWKKSPLQDLYTKIIDWTKDDQVRRDTEAKQLKLGYSYLEVLGAADKPDQREKVLEWAKGIVIIRVPYELAWKLEIEWQDLDNIGDYDVSVLRNYVDLFPNTGLATVLRAFLDSEISPFPVVEPEEQEEDEGGVSLIQDIGPDERLDFIIDGLERESTSILGHRILGEYYLLLSEYENAVDTCRKGLTAIARQAQISGLKFQKNTDALAVLLATALVHYQAPRHHNEATASFKDILTRNPKNTGALIGLGLILEDQGEFEEAAGFLRQALLSNPDNLKVISEAAWCEVQQGHYDLGIGELQGCLERITGVDPQSRDLKAQVLWRIGSALWDSEPEKRNSREGAYYHFMQALRSNPNFAPAYTSLGIYYADVSGDLERANKCFQKAFELSSGEYEAAERLARNFADTKDWELVEIVARRAADADKKRTTVGKAASWPQVALGVVELNNLNFPLAIQAFQAALRTSPRDVHSWIGLGEAYSNSGRYIAATKAFKQAQTLDPENWFITYMMANVERELGEFDSACDGYRAVLLQRPDEFGVIMALTEALVAASFHNLNTGLFGRAAAAASEALQISKKLVKTNPAAFNLWKAVGDACSVFSWVQSLLGEFPADDVSEILTTDIDRAEFNILSETDSVGASTLETYNDLPPLEKCLLASILAYKRGIYASAEDRHAHAVAWYNLGTAEYRALLCPEDRATKYRKAAITCFKRAIKLEPGNSDFWNALGVATSDVNARVSQHALVRALNINEKNARIWTNLGTLYMLHGDYQLANDAFTRGQSADPDYSHAWVGQGLVALATGQTADAPGLFEHAFQLSASESYSNLVKLQFASATFDVLLEQHRTDSSLTSLLNPMFASHQLIQQRSKDPISLRLAALYEERAGDFEGAVAKLSQVCDILEAKYEESEAVEDLIMYAQATADRARSYLGLKDYENAIESAELSFTLSQDLEVPKCRLSAHLTAGLAYYFTGKIDESLEMFKTALTESHENPDVVALLAQVLWAKGGDDEREVAMQQLMGSIEKNPEHLLSTMLLGVIGALQGDEGIVESVIEDLGMVHGVGRRSDEDTKKVDKLLLTLGEISGRNTSSICTTAIFLNPSNSAAWKSLADTSDEPFPANMALGLALSKTMPNLDDLCEALEASGTIDNDQMSLVIAPWRTEGWKRLAQDVGV